MNTQTIDGFLRKIRMHPDDTDMDSLVKAFLEEMNAGLEGKESSLAMIPTYISVGAGKPKPESVIVLDAGGTNMRRALVTFGEGEPVISDFLAVPMPGSLKPITKDEFLTQVAELIIPLADRSRKVGFCFSYVTEIQPDRDGRLVAFCKEVEVYGSDGMLVGQSLKEKLAEMGAGDDFSFTILNDTAACLMGGLARAGSTEHDGAAGLIIGTGTNTCYSEKGGNIGKLKNAADMIINMESGCFDKALRGESDILFDAGTTIPGDHAFEKMFSGAYHGGVMTVTAGLAAREGLFSDKFRDALENSAGFEMPEIDEFLKAPRGEGRLAGLCADENDEETLRCIIDRSFERAAKLVCGNIAAVMLKCDGGVKAPFMVTADGSAFQKSLLFRPKLERWVKEYIVNKLGRKVVFTEAADGNLLGAALSAVQ